MKMSDKKAHKVIADNYPQILDGVKDRIEGGEKLNTDSPVMEMFTAELSTDKPSYKEECVTLGQLLVYLAQRIKEEEEANGES